jgi:hypothetical protein
LDSLSEAGDVIQIEEFVKDVTNGIKLNMTSKGIYFDEIVYSDVPRELRIDAGTFRMVIEQSILSLADDLQHGR